MMCCLIRRIFNQDASFPNYAVEWTVQIGFLALFMISRVEDKMLWFGKGGKGSLSRHGVLELKSRV